MINIEIDYIGGPRDMQDVRNYFARIAIVGQLPGPYAGARMEIMHG